MTDGDLTIAILREIRDAIRTTNERLDATRTELSGRLDATRTELSGRLDRVVQEQIRHATAIVALEAGQREMVDVLKAVALEVHSLNDRLDHVLIGPMGETVRDHEDRLRRVEDRLGLAHDAR